MHAGAHPGGAEQLPWPHGMVGVICIAASLCAIEELISLYVYCDSHVQINYHYGQDLRQLEYHIVILQIHCI